MKNLKVKVCNNLFLNATTSFKKKFSKALRHYFVITYRFLIKQFQVLACNAFANKTIFKTKDCETGFTKITIVQQKCHSICMILMSLTEQLRHRSAKCSRHTFSVITFALVLGMVKYANFHLKNPCLAPGFEPSPLRLVTYLSLMFAFFMLQQLFFRMQEVTDF